MEPDELEELINQTSELLRAAGVGELANRERYTVRDPEAVGSRALPPDLQMTEMLVAFERHLANGRSQSMGRSTHVGMGNS